MTRLMQTASALTLAAALAGAPMIAMAQQATETESEAEQAVENVAQETEEAAGAAAEAVGEAAQETGEAVENAAQETGQVLDVTVEETEQSAEQVEEAAEDKAEAVEEQSEEQAEAIEQAGEQQAEAIEEGAEGAVVVEAEPVEPVDGAIQMQDDNSILTSDLMGATVFNAQAEKVGEIDDAILSLDGTIDGVVIGVGGFLGIGEKHVAVEMQQISVQTDEDGKPMLLIDTTREALEAAPEFVTAEDQREEAERLEAATAPAGGMSTSDTAPASGMVPPPPAPAGEAQPVQN